MALLKMSSMDRCNISNDATNDDILRITFSDFMSEGTNEEGSGEEEQEWGDIENEGRNSHIPPKGRFVWQGVGVSLWMMLGCSLQVAM